MRIARSLSRGARLLAAILVVGCASAPTPTPTPARAALGKTAIVDLDALLALPVGVQRRELDAVVAAHPEELAARYIRIEVAVKMGDVATVLADSDIALAHPALDRIARKDVLEQRAEALIQTRKFDEAIVAANQALEIDASSAHALLARGWALHFIEQPDAALADLDRGLPLEPDEGIGYMRRATVLRDQGKFDRARQDFARAIELVPDDGPSHCEYGVLLYRTHEFESALAQFDVAARLRPHDPANWAWRAQADRALQRFDDAKADDALAEASAATSEDLVAGLYNVGIVLEGDQDFEGSAREFGRAFALMPTVDPREAASLARTQWFAGQYAQAVETFRKYKADAVANSYVPLWLFVVRGRAYPADEPAAKVELRKLVPPHQPHAWIDTLVDLSLGNTTLQAALDEADASATAVLRAGRRCEADFYAAEQLLMHDEEAPAARLLDEAARVCPSNYIVAPGVGAERRRLQARSPAR